MDKYLFLDFDGVLNTANYAKRLKWEGIDLYDEFGPMFDPTAIANLKRIVDETGCKIVLSTTWRNEGFMRMEALWKDRNLPGELMSMTPILLCTTYQDARNGEFFSITERNAKALEINAWLEQTGKQCSYVIIDDENVFFQSQQKHLVLTNEHDGLTYEKAKLAIEILNH